MPAIYDGLVFRTRLEAQWAAFFDLADWSWWANPAPVNNWQPDFKVSFKCGHSECSGKHTLFLSVLPLSSLESFRDHPCMTHSYGVRDEHGQWFADGGAAFGNSPEVTSWEISHGAGGGIENVEFRVDNANSIWKRASELIE